MNENVLIDDALSLSVGPYAVTLEADEALLLAADLSRCAFRKIASEERADFLFDDESGSSAPTEQ
tara:strand:- start:181 stop:375 length:195 start_codon:yes stop_codon:yes gene_type:complete